jgi:hypothetical protein
MKTGNPQGNEFCIWAHEQENMILAGQDPNTRVPSKYMYACLTRWTVLRRYGGAVPSSSDVYRS